VNVELKIPWVEMPSMLIIITRMIRWEG